MNEKLLPCPCCTTGSGRIIGAKTFIVECDNPECKHATEYFAETVTDAMTLWNTRNCTPEYIATLIHIEAEERGCGVISVLEDVTHLLFPELRGDNA